MGFLFSYLSLNMFIFFIINFKNFTKLKIMGVYGSFLCVYFLVIYGSSEIIHARQDGLTPGQLAIVFGMSILTNLLIQCAIYFSKYNCSICDADEFQSVLAFENDIENHYSTKLKKYSNF